MPGPYVIRDVALLLSLDKKDAVIDDADVGAKEVQCVFLVKNYTDCGSTKDWKKGLLVKEAIASCSPGMQTGIARGTAIATFNKDGKYASNPKGNHACFFIEEQKDGSGFLVLEQHVDPHPDKIQMRVLKYKGVPDGGKIQVDNGDCYSVIL
jgi:hypothetical protein